MHGGPQEGICVGAKARQANEAFGRFSRTVSPVVREYPAIDGQNKRVLTWGPPLGNGFFSEWTLGLEQRFQGPLRHRGHPPDEAFGRSSLAEHDHL